MTATAERMDFLAEHTATRLLHDRKTCPMWTHAYARCRCGVVTHEPIAYEHTVAGRCDAHPGFAKLVAAWAQRGIVYQDPTPALLELQAEKRRQPPRPGVCFDCLCMDSRLHYYGTTCTDCGMDGSNWLFHLVRAGFDRLILVDEETHVRTAHYFSDRPPEVLGGGKPWGKYGQ